MAEKKQSDKTAELAQTEASSQSGAYQNYYLPEYNVAVKARSASEAVKKAQEKLKAEGSK